jgi:hypothetical protein
VPTGAVLVLAIFLERAEEEEEEEEETTQGFCSGYESEARGTLKFTHARAVSKFAGGCSPDTRSGHVIEMTEHTNQDQASERVQLRGGEKTRGRNRGLSHQAGQLPWTWEDPLGYLVPRAKLVQEHHRQTPVYERNLSPTTGVAQALRLYSKHR